MLKDGAVSPGRRLAAPPEGENFATRRGSFSLHYPGASLYCDRPRPPLAPASLKIALAPGDVLGAPRERVRKASSKQVAVLAAGLSLSLSRC